MLHEEPWAGLHTQDVLHKIENYLGIIILTNAKILDSPSPHLSTSWRGLQSPCCPGSFWHEHAPVLCAEQGEGAALHSPRQAAGSWGNNEVLLCWCNSLSGGEEMLPWQGQGEPGARGHVFHAERPSWCQHCSCIIKLSTGQFLAGGSVPLSVGGTRRAPSLRTEED